MAVVNANPCHVVCKPLLSILIKQNHQNPPCHDGCTPPHLTANVHILTLDTLRARLLYSVGSTAVAAAAIARFLHDEDLCSPRHGGRGPLHESTEEAGNSKPCFRDVDLLTLLLSYLAMGGVKLGGTSRDRKGWTLWLRSLRMERYLSS